VNDHGIDFAMATRSPKSYFGTEAAFCDHLMADASIWYRMGLHVPFAYRTHTTPDFLVHVRPEKRGQRVRPKPIVMGVEAELEAKNFKTHGHDPYNIGLCISFMCWWPTRKVKSVDVVSFYRHADDGWWHWSLDDDIDMLFHGRKSILWPT
jgi:hypothetical protein